MTAPTTEAGRRAQAALRTLSDGYYGPSEDHYIDAFDDYIDAIDIAAIEREAVAAFVEKGGGEFPHTLATASEGGPTSLVRQIRPT